MIKVVGYSRVSSEEQATRDLSIPAQIKAIKRYVDDRKDMILVAEFKDEGISAYASADRRPGLMEMIKLAKSTDVSQILVHKLDRFSRNREESIIFKSLLKKHGVQVMSITENFDPDTPSGFLFEGIIEVINQFYSMNLAMETRKGMIENATRGYWNGGTVPYGYDLIEVPGNGDRVHKKLSLGDPVEVAAVRYIFDLAVNYGMGSKAIVNRLEAEGISQRNGKSWIKQRVGYILNNQVYYGASVWNRTHSKTRTLKPENEWIVIENMHEPIIPKELFMKRKNMAQAKIGKRFRTTAHKGEWLLAKMIRCDKCGRAYIGIDRKRIIKSGGKHQEKILSRYACSGHITMGNKECQSFYIDKDYLENVVLNLIKSEITSEKRLSDIEMAVRKRLSELQCNQDETQKPLKDRLNEIELGIERYYDAISTGLDPDVCKNKIDGLQQKKALLERDLHGKESSLKVAELFENDMRILRRLIKNFNKEFLKLPFEKRRMIVLHFIERIDIIDYSIARITLQVPKMTPNRRIKPPMSKKTKEEVRNLLAENKNEAAIQNASSKRDQVSSLRGARILSHQAEQYFG